jgi:R3H domain
MRPLPVPGIVGELSEEQRFEQLLNESFQQPAPHDLEDLDDLAGLPKGERPLGPNGEELLYIYPYGVSRQQLDQVIQTLLLPVVLTKDLEHADAVLSLRSHVKNHSKLRSFAKLRQIPIHTVKSSSIPQIARTLRRLLDMDDPAAPDVADLTLFARSGNNDDELEALEEARLAVEQIVIPKSQPVELLPRSATVRKMQHELVEHYHLKSRSFGEEPNRRLRIYPA